MKPKTPLIPHSKITKNIYQPTQNFTTKWSGAFKIKNPIPADKIRDLIDYSNL